jgi:hypothetical protein
MESLERRWLRGMRQIERRLGGDPRKLIPPKGMVRRTFDRLAQKHEGYRQKVIARREEILRNKTRSRLLPTDPAELRAMRIACGLPASSRVV